ncbi:GNAT family N-acetyltransferase [Streptomyces sp. NPDC002669]|uniref:GNAT family N-acetyltransferase n=1 Tax=Streptomyces sp. NPDC002669 TaxID=3364658 RepID=UPI0036C77FD1
MVTCDADTVLVARTDGAIVGTLTLVMLPLPSGVWAHIEDVGVDDAARGRGVDRLSLPARWAEEPGRYSRPAPLRPQRRDWARWDGRPDESVRRGTTRSSETGPCRPGRAPLHLEHAPGGQREGTPRASSVVMVLPGAAVVSASHFPSWKGRPRCNQTMSDQARP